MRPPALPPLGTLRFFEAAARHLSFTLAARELGLTQSAVSYQIKLLEDFLGVALFRRLNRALLLTEAGQRYLTEIRPALVRVGAATEGLTPAKPAEGRVLSVSVLPSFAAKCLVPRLATLRERLPGIDLRISATTELARPGAAGIDCCLRHGGGEWPGVVAERLGGEEVFPVCSPRLAWEHRVGQRAEPFRPAHLLGLPLLHDVGDVSWADWLGRFGVEAPSILPGATFTDSAMLLQAAIDGMGVALGRSVLARDDLAAGRLIRPLPEALPYGGAYWLVRPTGAIRPLVKLFRDWLREEYFG